MLLQPDTIETPLQARAPAPLLELQGLRTQFTIGGEVANAVDGLSLQVRAGEALGIVGESGSGKSVTALSIMRLLGGAHGLSGRVLFAGRDVLAMSSAELRALRGGDISMIFQDPMTSLNPVIKIGRQLIEGMSVHGRFTGKEARARALSLLQRMGISSPERVMNGYAHELSGGMRQRVMLAIGFANKPQLIIADEPTTALDVTVQAQILDLLKEVSRESGTAVILISHDLGVIANVCSRVAVMYGGEVVEEGPTQDLLTSPQHPYTWALLNAAPHIDSESNADRHLPSIGGMPPDILNLPNGCRFADRCPYRVEQCDAHPQLLPLEPGRLSRCWVTQAGAVLSDAGVRTAEATPPAAPSAAPRSLLLEVKGLVKHFDVRGDGLFTAHRKFRAVDGVNFSIYRGEMVGLVGESG
jgi:peptide/nickel transport system ATP-binding protein